MVAVGAGLQDMAAARELIALGAAGIVARPYDRRRLVPQLELFALGAKPATVLVVDDSNLIRRRTVEALDKAGHTVLQAVDGQEALGDFLPEFPLLRANSRGGFVWWTAQNFRNKFQAFDGGSNGQDLPFDLAQFPVGLGASDFGEVEWGGVPDLTGRGESGFADVTVLPEPATMSLLALGGMVVLARKRRRK